MAPAELRVRPAGKLPEVIDQVYGGTPPEAASEALVSANDAAGADGEARRRRARCKRPAEAPLPPVEVSLVEYGTLITAAGRAVEVMTNGASGSTVCRYRRRGRIRTGIRKYGEKSALQPGHQCPHGSNRGEGSTHGAVTIVPASQRD